MTTKPMTTAELHRAITKIMDDARLGLAAHLSTRKEHLLGTAIIDGIEERVEDLLFKGEQFKWLNRPFESGTSRYGD